MENELTVHAEKAFQLLRERLLKAATKLVPADIAEDLTQDAIVVLLTSDRYKDTPEPQLVFAGISIMKFKCWEWRRRQAKNPPIDRDHGDKEAAAKKIFNRQLSAELIAGLSEKGKKAILLRWLAGMSHEEIQKELDLPSANASASLCGKSLRKMMLMDDNKQQAED
jgi:RNA polymerase sigma factor (sigma-70 family)